jgi:hypothetical protein
VSVLSRFMNDRSGLALPTLERLVQALGLELVERKRRRRNTKATRSK